MLLRHFVSPLGGQPTVLLRPVGQCIYCGEQSGPLDLEHIIPESIGGRLHLPDATCPCGHRITHAFEGKVVAQIFNQVRRQMGIRGKRRKRPVNATHLPISERFIDQPKKEDFHLIPPDEHPSTLMLPRLNPVAYLGSHRLAQLMQGGSPLPMDVWNLTSDGDTRTAKLKDKGMQGVWLLQSIEMTPFIQLLAKIAHCAAVATLGPNGFKASLIPIINGADVSEANSLIGEMPTDGPRYLPFAPAQGLHEIFVGQVSTALGETIVVQIRFFSNLMRRTLPFHTPMYAVIAGTVEQRGE